MIVALERHGEREKGRKEERMNWLIFVFVVTTHWKSHSTLLSVARGIRFVFMYSAKIHVNKILITHFHRIAVRYNNKIVARSSHRRMQIKPVRVLPACRHIRYCFPSSLNCVVSASGKTDGRYDPRAHPIQICIHYNVLCLECVHLANAPQIHERNLFHFIELIKWRAIGIEIAAPAHPINPLLFPTILGFIQFSVIVIDTFRISMCVST